MSRKRTQTTHVGIQAAIREDAQGQAVLRAAERAEETKRGMQAAHDRLVATGVVMHLIVDVTPDRPGARDEVKIACGLVVESTTNLTRNRTLVTCPKCLDELRKPGAAYGSHTDLRARLAWARADLLNDPTLKFNDPPALAIDKFIARVLGEG